MTDSGEQRTDEHGQPTDPPAGGWAPPYGAPPSPFEQATGAESAPPPATPGGRFPMPPPQSAPPGQDPTLWLRPPTTAGGAPGPAPPATYLGAPPLPVWPTPATYHEPEPENGKATAAMVLGIAGLGLWFMLGLGLLFFVNLPCSALAWIYGIQARRRIEAGKTTRGEGAARAGVILGVVGVILGVLALVGWVLLFVLAI